MALRPQGALAMTRAAAGGAFFLSALLLATFAAASAPSPRVSGDILEASLLTPVQVLPLEVEQIQREADYTKDRRAYVVHTTGLIALGIGLGLILLWRFGVDVALRFRADPLPKRVRARLDRLHAVQQQVVSAVRACPVQQRNFGLFEERQFYEELAAATDGILDKIRQDLRLNFVDEDALVAELDRLIERGQSLSSRLRRIAPVPSPTGDDQLLVLFGTGALHRINRGWERVFAGKTAKLITIEQLSSMRWPPWASLTRAPR